MLSELRDRELLRRVTTSREVCQGCGVRKGRGEGKGGVRWSGQKIGHKINSIQPAEYSLLLGSNISWRSPLQGRVGSFSRGGCNNGTLYRAPDAQSQHPYIIIHTGKKAGGTFAKLCRRWGTAKLSTSSIFSETYREITSCKINSGDSFIYPETMIVLW